MPPWESLVAFSLTSLLLIVVPGPSVLFVIGRSLALGRRGGLLSVLGNGLGALPLVVAVAIGLGAVVAQSVLWFTIVKLLGAAYLVYLGIQAIRHRHVDLAAGSVDVPTAVSDARTIGQGFVVGVTNPKTIVFFVAVLPQFVDFHAGLISVQMIVLGTIFVLLAFASDAAWAILAGTARQWFARSPRRISGLRATGGALMIGLGGVLALTGRTP